MSVGVGWLGAVHTNTVMRAIVLAVAALPVVGCGVTVPRFASTGLGAATSLDFSLPAGAYSVTWAADDEPGPPAGCRFDLVLDGDQDVLNAEQPLGRVIPKLAHETTGAGGTIRGTAMLALAEGTYRFHVEGTCAWRVSIVDG